MSIIFSHHLAVEFYRNLRRDALPRTSSMRDWLADPEYGLRLIQSGQIDLASSSTRHSKTLSSPVLTADACNKVLAESRIPTQKETEALRRNIAALSHTNSAFHVLVDSRSKRAHARSAKCHLISAQLWNGALWHVIDDVYICSPELVFMQMATLLSRPLLVRYGLELCSGYSVQPQSTRGFADTYAITTPQLLQQHIKAARHVKGSSNARVAALRVLPNAASPAESDTFIITCFPRKEGGYGLPYPELNGKVTITKPNGKETERFCDMLWREICLAMEYLGVESHVGWNAVSSGATRQGELALNGIRVVPLTKDHVSSISRMDAIVGSLEKAMHLKRREPPSEFRKRQLKLFSTIFPQRNR